MTWASYATVIEISSIILAQGSQFHRWMKWKRVKGWKRGVERKRGVNRSIREPEEWLASFTVTQGTSHAPKGGCDGEREGGALQNNTPVVFLSPSDAWCSQACCEEDSVSFVPPLPQNCQAGIPPFFLSSICLSSNPWRISSSSWVALPVLFSTPFGLSKMKFGLDTLGDGYTHQHTCTHFQLCVSVCVRKCWSCQTNHNDSMC